MDDARLCLSVALTAAVEGASVLNYTEVVSLLKDGAGKVTGARLRDTESGEEFDVRAEVVVNATGPFTGTALRAADS